MGFPTKMCFSFFLATASPADYTHWKAQFGIARIEKARSFRGAKILGGGIQDFQGVAGGCLYLQRSIGWRIYDTVDGRNPAPPGIYKTW